MIRELLDNFPLGSVMTVGAGVVALIGYLNGDLSVFEALAAWGITGIGGGAIGGARAASGKGLARHRRPSPPTT